METRINTRRTASGEPKELYVQLEGWDGTEILLMNDGVMTVKRVLNGSDEVKQVLQGRSAFRGFVGTFIELFCYTIKKAWAENDNEYMEE